MSNATIGDGIAPIYEFDWGDKTRTTDELGDLEKAGFDATIEDICDVAKDDPECEVTLVGFGN